MRCRPSNRRGSFLAVGLTGGIASGKNYVADLLEAEGIPVVDADPIGHELIRPGAPCYRPLVKLFGRGVLARNGQVVHRRVSEIVFADAKKRRALNALMHPPILREADRRARELHRSRGHPIVVVSAALLVEAGAERRFDRVVLVACRPEVQLRRLLRRDQIDVPQAKARLAAQISDARRRRVAHYVIDNSGSRQQTCRQVSRLVRNLRRAAGTQRGRRPRQEGGARRRQRRAVRR